MSDVSEEQHSFACSNDDVVCSEQVHERIKEMIVDLIKSKRQHFKLNSKTESWISTEFHTMYPDINLSVIDSIIKHLSNDK